MNKAHHYALYQLAIVFKHPYAWLIIVVANVFGIYSLIGFQDTLIMHDIHVPGQVLILYLTGSWNFITYGVYVLFTLFAVLYYQAPHFDQQMAVRLGGRHRLFIGRLLSFLYISFGFSLSILLLPIITGFVIGSSEPGWGSDMLALTQADTIMNVHPVIDTLTENASYIASYSPLFGMFIHVMFLVWSLVIFMLLLDLVQKFLKSKLWGTVITLGYAFFYSFLIAIPGLNTLALFTLQTHSMILPKVEGQLGGFIPYSYSVLFFIIISLALLACSYWKERYLQI